MKKYSLIILSLLVLLLACQPASVIRQQRGAAEIDSTLYFTQTDISDPFLDTVFQAPQKDIVLKDKVIPPPPPVLPYKEVEGFRVQIFAGIDSVNAVSSMASARQLQPADSVYWIREAGLIKIQVGDYLYRYLADNSRALFKRSGFPGAWVVQRAIRIPVTPEVTPSAAQANPPEVKEGKYRIQVMASGSEENARRVVAELQQIGDQAFYRADGELFKVFLGPYAIESEARAALEKIRSAGYPDAWLAY
jgi:hypothetical protein